MPPKATPAALTIVAGDKSMPLPIRTIGRPDPPTNVISDSQFINYIRGHRMIGRTLSDDAPKAPPTIFMMAQTGLRVLVLCPTLIPMDGSYSQDIRGVLNSLQARPPLASVPSNHRKSSACNCFGLQMLLKTLVTCDDGILALSDTFGSNPPMDRIKDLLWFQGGASFVQVMILPHLSRIRSLTSILLTREDMLSFLGIPEKDLTQLQATDIMSIDNFDRSSFKGYRVHTTPKHAILTGCVDVHSDHKDAVPLRAFSISRLIDDFLIPWSQVTHVVLSNFPVKFHHLLERVLRPLASTLICGVLNVTFDKRKYLVKYLPKLGRPVEMRALTTLYLNLESPSQHPGFFSYIRLPEIRFLEVTSIDQYHRLNWDIEALTALLCPLISSSESSHAHSINRTLTTLRLNDRHPTNCVPTTNVFRSSNSDRTSSLLNVSSSLSKLLSHIPFLTQLILPILFPIHPQTLYLIGTGHLLPYLVSLNAITPWINPVYDMVLERNSAIGCSRTPCAALKDVQIIVFGKARISEREWRQWSEVESWKFCGKAGSEDDFLEDSNWNLVQGVQENMVSINAKARALERLYSVKINARQFLEHPTHGLGTYTTPRAQPLT